MNPLLDLAGRIEAANARLKEVRDDYERLRDEARIDPAVFDHAAAACDSLRYGYVAGERAVRQARIRGGR